MNIQHIIEALEELDAEKEAGTSRILELEEQLADATDNHISWEIAQKEVARLESALDAQILKTTEEEDRLVRELDAQVEKTLVEEGVAVALQMDLDELKKELEGRPSASEVDEILELVDSTQEKLKVSELALAEAGALVYLHEDTVKALWDYIIRDTPVDEDPITFNNLPEKWRDWFTEDGEEIAEPAHLNMMRSTETEPTADPDTLKALREEVNEVCSDCGSPMRRRWLVGGKITGCSNPACNRYFKRKAPPVEEEEESRERFYIAYDGQVIKAGTSEQLRLKIIGERTSDQSATAAADAEDLGEFALYSYSTAESSLSDEKFVVYRSGE